VKYILASLDQWTQGLHKELDAKMEETAGVTNVPPYADPKPRLVDN
jgi:hypothetical protein